MRYFVTGASGYIGSVLTAELIAAGHHVLGLARSDKSAEKLKSMGAEVLRGDLNDLDVLKQGASTTDGVAHLGFVHDFANFAASIETDLQATLAMASVMHGTHKPLVASFGVLFLPKKDGKAATENDFHDLNDQLSARAKNERALLEQAQYGVSAMSLRLSPTTHGNGDMGFMSVFIDAARKNGRSVYIGDGADVWPTCHVNDSAHLYRLALEKPIAGQVLHAVHEQGVPWKRFATTIGDKLKLPTVSIKKEEAPAHFGLLAMFLGSSHRVSSNLTQQRFGWKPNGPGLIEDLEQGHYFEDKGPAKYAV